VSERCFICGHTSHAGCVEAASDNAAHVILHMVLDEVQCDEFLTWYKPQEWIGMHRAVATFIRIKLRP